jgi:pimeloyl-ACP methyl ester carboxylesterase
MLPKEFPMKKGLRVSIIVLGALLLLTIAVLLVSPDKRRLDEAVRSESGAAFIELSEGFVEYEAAGPESGTPVVLIHGLSVPMFDWDNQFRDLAAAGFRVIRYNQYGRGLSDRPRGRYDSARYVQQLKELTDALEVGPVNMVAHSMGCPIAAEFVARYPESADRVVLIAPVLHMAEGNTGISLVRIPLIGDVSAKTILPGILASRADSLFLGAGVSRAGDYSQKFREQMQYRGFSRSVKSLFRGDMVDNLSGTYEQLDGTNLLAVRGTRDESVPAAHFDAIVALLPAMEVVTLDAVGHMPTMETPDVVSDIVLEFLRR